MTEYKVYLNEGRPPPVQVFADSVEIEEGGVLAFYEQPGDDDTLMSVAGDDVLVEAYAEWERFEEA